MSETESPSSQASPVEGYLHYMRTVLGVENVVWPVGDAIPAAPVPSPFAVDGSLASARLLAFLPLAGDEFPLRGPMLELIDRMLKAMKLEAREVARISWDFSASRHPPALGSILAAAGSRPVLVFGIAEAGQLLGAAVDPGTWQTWRDGANPAAGEARVVATFAPRDLLGADANERKRVAWAHLQTVMKELT